MAAPAALLSSANMRWRTPTWFLDLVRQVALIAFDPASAADNPTGATRFCTPVENGLVQPWPLEGLVYVNPPYGAHLSGPIDPWRLVTRRDPATGVECVMGWGTGWAERMAAHEGEGLYLVPCRRETDWWRTLSAWCGWRCQWKSPTYGARINFTNDPIDPVSKNGSTFSNTVFYKGPNVSKFVAAFSPHGDIEPGERVLRELMRCAIAAGWRP